MLNSLSSAINILYSHLQYNYSRSLLKRLSLIWWPHRNLFKIIFALLSSFGFLTLLIFSTIWTYCLNESLLLSNYEIESCDSLIESLIYDYLSKTFSYLFWCLFCKLYASLIVLFWFFMKFYLIYIGYGISKLIDISEKS